MPDVPRNKFEAPKRIVKPRMREYKKFPIIAIAGERTLDENGEIGTLPELIGRLPFMEATCLVTTAATAMLATFDSIYEPMWSNWQFRTSKAERERVGEDGTITVRESYPISYFGWQKRGGGPKYNKNCVYHRMIDPVIMYGRSPDEAIAMLDGIIYKDRVNQPGKRCDWTLDLLPRLFAWGVLLRDFCHENNLDLRPTIGGIAAQFATDKRFYPNARRKVPAVINERTREYLPGNHYSLSINPKSDKRYNAIYIDQTRAHHYHARTSPMPNSNSLWACGYFHDLEAIAFSEVPNPFYGLLCVDLEAPANKPRWDWIKPTDSLEKYFVFSNELTHLMDMGYKVKGVRACWGSWERDVGLPKYAAWACEQLDHYNGAAWLKPILLATYGTLAVKPKYHEAIFKQAKAGIPTVIFAGHAELEGICVISPQKLEPNIANVMHRGIIEAATRSESVGLAQYLENLGYYVLQIYADAVIVEDDGDKPLPDLPEPWRIKERLTNLTFHDLQSFSSDQMTKLPGISLGSRERMRIQNLRSKAPKLPDPYHL